MRAPVALWEEIDRIAEERTAAVRTIVIEALELRVAVAREERGEE